MRRTYWCSRSAVSGPTCLTPWLRRGWWRWSGGCSRRIPGRVRTHLVSWRTFSFPGGAVPVDLALDGLPVAATSDTAATVLSGLPAVVLGPASPDEPGADDGADLTPPAQWGSAGRAASVRTGPPIVRRRPNAPGPSAAGSGDASPAAGSGDASPAAGSGDASSGGGSSGDASSG